MMSPLGEYAKLLVERWRWVAWGILLAMLMTTVVLLVAPPKYRTQATVFVRTPGDISRVQDGGDMYARARVETYAALANSMSVSSRVIADLGLSLAPEVLSDRIAATPREGTALLDLSVSAPSAAEAQRIATVLLSELESTVHDFESVPGSLVPRAELVVVDPPLESVRVTAFGLPIAVLLSGAGLLGVMLGAAAAVIRSMFMSPGSGWEPAIPGDDPNRGAYGLQLSTSQVSPVEASTDGRIDGVLEADAGRHVGKHRRSRRVAISHPVATEELGET